MGFELSHRLWLLLLQAYQRIWPIEVLHEWTATHASLLLRLPDSFQRASLNVLQVTDVHLSEDPLASHEWRHAERMHGAFRSARDLFNGSTIEPISAFRELLDEAAASEVDLVALTGDIVNFPQDSMVRWVMQTLNSTLGTIPYTFCAGNHDWFYEASDASQRELRLRWRQKSLHPLYARSATWQAPANGRATAAGYFDYGAVEMNGLLILTIDNSIYQVSEEQLVFFQSQILRWVPTILLLHVPLSVREELRPFHGFALCGDPAWGAETDRSWTHERRARWPESGNDRSTELFLEAVQAAASPRGPLIAVLTGHVHQHSAAPFGALDEGGESPEASTSSQGKGSARGAVQYVSLAGYQGGFLFLEARTMPPGAAEFPPLAVVQERLDQRFACAKLLTGLSRSLAGSRGCWDVEYLAPTAMAMLDLAWVHVAIDQMLMKTEAGMRAGFRSLARALHKLLGAKSSCPDEATRLLGLALSHWADPAELHYVRGRTLSFGAGRDVLAEMAAGIHALKKDGDWEDFGVQLGYMIEIVALGAAAPRHEEKLRMQAAAHDEAVEAAARDAEAEALFHAAQEAEEEFQAQVQVDEPHDDEEDESWGEDLHDEEHEGPGEDGTTMWKDVSDEEHAHVDEEGYEDQDMHFEDSTSATSDDMEEAILDSFGSDVDGASGDDAWSDI
mmetsp:Transcript_25399/g.70706  ORF Transcript_25399/g.70706 Transcript_25399/m.70706 type:complete len:676 (-) Transcript_25399:81-2108(-)